jgi:hypothetical protein
VQAQIDNALHALSPDEIVELQSLLAGEVAAADADAEAVRVQAEQEAALAKAIKPVVVRIPRRASTILAAEVERRIARGVYPSAESLVGEAVTKAFAGGRAHENLCSVAGCVRHLREAESERDGSRESESGDGCFRIP